MNSSNSSDAIIETTIEDFSKTSDYYEANSVFAINKRPLLQLVTDSVNKNNYKIINGQPYQGLISVNVEVNDQKFAENSESKVGSKGTELPTRYMVKDNKLFFWWDSDFEFTQDTFDTLKTYNLIGDSSNSTTEGKNRGLQYYYCENDINKFTKRNLEDDKNGDLNLTLLCPKND